MAGFCGCMARKPRAVRHQTLPRRHRRYAPKRGDRKRLGVCQGCYRLGSKPYRLAAISLPIAPSESASLVRCVASDTRRHATKRARRAALNLTLTARQFKARMTIPPILGSGDSMDSATQGRVTGSSPAPLRSTRIVARRPREKEAPERKPRGTPPKKHGE